MLNTNLGWLEGFPVEVAGGTVRWRLVSGWLPPGVVLSDTQAARLTLSGVTRVAGTFFQDWVGGEPSREKCRRTLGGPVDGAFQELWLLDEQGLVTVQGDLDAYRRCFEVLSMAPRTSAEPDREAAAGRVST